MAQEFAPLPPGPTTPAVWQLLRYSHSPLAFLEACARRHGDPFTVRWAGYGTFVVLASPDAVQDVATHGENILADLLAASHADGRPLSNQEVRDALVTMIFAGHDTTSVALAWTLEQIVPRADDRGGEMDLTWC